MNAQCESSGTNGISLSMMPGSDDSDEDTSQDEQPITSWNDLSIIERVGLNSLEMSEKDVETAFCQITLAFRCDQYTLKQRLQAEEHARNLAEENVQLELTRGRETLEMLKALCLDSRRSTILQKLELSLDILGGTVERISNTAEVLGAVHQEARVSRAVELMVAHVENLRHRYERNLSELEEARRQIQLRQSCRNILNNTASPDPKENTNDKKLHKQASLRRRVSSSIITSQMQSFQEKKKKDKKRGSKKSSSVSPSPCPSSESSFCVNNDSCSTDDRTVVDSSEAPEVFEKNENLNEPPPAAVESKPESSPTKQVTTANIPGKNSTLDTLRQRHRGRSALSKRRAEKRSQNLSQRPPADKCGPQCKDPGTDLMYRCSWPLLSLYIFLLFCFFTMIYFLLML